MTFTAGLMIALVISARAQLQVGDNVSMRLNGNLSFGYTGDFSNVAGSDHTINPSGNADLSGSYYSPSFLSFDVQPFYNESRVNSTYQSAFQSTGVNGSASIFSGSHFPGSVAYSKTFNSQGTFAVPGVGDFTTRGNSDNLSIGWGIRIPDYPTVSFQFADGDNTSSIFGTDANATFHSKTFGVTANDTLAGFILNGGYRHNTVHSLIPEFLVGEGPQTSDTSSNTFDVGVQHKLPMHGSFSAAGSRSDLSAESSGDHYNTTIDTASSGVGFEPVKNLNAGVNATYTNNLEGSLYQSVITSGVVVPPALLNYSTHSLDINSQANYVLPALHLTLIASADRREQTLLGSSISSDSLDEMVSYGNELFHGFVNATLGFTQTSVNFASNTSSRGFLSNLSYTRKLRRWNLNGSFNYSHNTQTVLIGYTSSGHGYSAGIGRKFGTSSYWSINAAGSKSTFSNSTGSDNFSQSYSTALSVRKFSVSGGYSKADGTSILTPTGLTPISNPLPGTVPVEAIVFNGKSYSFGASLTPVYGLVLSGSYSKTNSSTTSLSAASQNETQQLNTMLQYKVRKLWITGGYLKLRQGFSITGTPPSSDSSFFVGITRWFNFF
ncbi:MAG TPA: hypothetical protein VMH04_16055 [Candidatus Solibacter sp.]|nr:hypothetical protein [Candidatus Solibacter sp.]